MLKKIKARLSKIKVHEYWKNCYHSSMRNMSAGAQHILKLITSAHKDNWRRGREKKK